MSVLEAFSTNTPVMLRDLDLYHSIINGYYIGCKDEAEMNVKLRELINDPVLLSEYRQRSITASDRYSEDHLAKIWYDFYTEQSKEGQYVKK
ncbi:glycosyltransferase LafB [Lentilactobacillus kosonis]|uniref:Glycosyltransferase LafB n=1 Tax=Lentilactobacillus kosonis TaxID=2810561 RepID=A0A401FPU5_9LACO|nr:glycosyltransferase LafB [Lentilactobacillus kosonis]